MTEPAHVVALSGGKDSTAMALRLATEEPRDYTYLCTPTGDDLPEMSEHWDKLEVMLNKPLHRIVRQLPEDAGPMTLRSLSDFVAGPGNPDGILPNWRQRWCTRMLKIEPCIQFMASLPEGSVIYVGLRADEPLREGIISAELANDFPLRRWGWGIKDVRAYLREMDVKIPTRTDCARCYGQRLVEWKALLIEHPDIYADAEADEERTGHTYRSPGRDSWPAPLSELRELWEEGHEVRGEGRWRQFTLFDDDPEETGCRVCKL